MYLIFSEICRPVKQIVLSCMMFFLAASAAGQDGLGFQQSNRLHIRRTSEKIRIDGEATENTWSLAETASDFWEKWPNDKERAKRKTEVKMAYDDLNIYLFVKAYDTSYYVIQTLKRDNGLYDSDAFSIALDPVNQRRPQKFERISQPDQRKDRELVSLILQGPIVENPDDAQEVVGRKPEEERDRSGDEVMKTDVFGE